LVRCPYGAGRIWGDPKFCGFLLLFVEILGFAYNPLANDDFLLANLVNLPKCYALLDLCGLVYYNYTRIIISTNGSVRPFSERSGVVKKRILAFLLVVLTVGSLILPVMAAGTPTVSISSGSVKAGETVELTVSIADNPGIAATVLYLYFDGDTFETDPNSDIAAVGRFFTTGAIIGNSIENAKANGRYYGEFNTDGVLVLWYNKTGTDTQGDGEMLKVFLKAKKDAANGDYTVRVGYSAMDTCNGAGEAVALQTGKATVRVTGGTEEKAPDSFVVEEVPEFTDVTGNWAETYIRQAASLGLVEGYLGKYRPNDTMTRAEFVTILWRAQGEPAPTGKATFTDLTQDWYRDAVAWAEENKVVDGVGNGKFAPTAPVTREQLVTILHRMAGKPMGMELMLYPVYDQQYPDSGQIGAWAKPSLYWSIINGIYCGESAVEIGSQLAPRANATRAQIAVMIVRYLSKVN